MHGTSWRDYALKLEKECTDLKVEMNVSQTKLLILSNATALSGTTHMHCAISSDPTSKKKKVTASTGKQDDRHVVSKLNSILGELSDGREPAKLFVALDHFAQLASLHQLPDFPINIFFSATRSVIHAASDALHSILETDSNLNRLQVLHDLMGFVIETSFLLLPSCSESFGYLLFNRLSELLLSPVIHSFFPLSIKSLEYILEPANTNTREPKGAHQKCPKLHVDCRPKLLEFFQGILSGLFPASYSLTKTTSGVSFCQDASSMRDMLMLETIRHLKGILSPIPGDKHNPDATDIKRGRKASLEGANEVDLCSEKYLRVRRLAVKDAVWYLCSVFHILIGSKTAEVLSPVVNSSNKSIKNLDGTQQAGSGILEKIILRELFELLTDTRLRHYEKSRLPLDTSQTPVGSLASMLNVLSNNKQASCFTSHIDKRHFDHTDCHDSEKYSSHGTEVVSGIVTEGNNMHHVLDDAERGMLLCVVERYVNER